MPTLIHLVAQRVFRSRGARADRDVGIFGYAWVALVEYPCCRNVFGGGEGKGWDGRGEKEVGGGRVVLEGPWGWCSGGREKEMGDALLLASLLAVEPVFWTFSEI